MQQVFLLYVTDVVNRKGKVPYTLVFEPLQKMPEQKWTQCQTALRTSDRNFNTLPW